MSLIIPGQLIVILIACLVALSAHVVVLPSVLLVILCALLVIRGERLMILGALFSGALEAISRSRLA